MTCIVLPHRFKQRPYQIPVAKALLVDNKKFAVQVFHRRAGKTKNVINISLALALKRKGLYYHAFPEIKQAKKAVWYGMDKDGMRHLDHIPKGLIQGKPNETDLRIKLVNGSIIQYVGADRYNNLMGGGPAGIIFDEYSLMHPLAWHHLSPILAENNGWALFTYTPRGHNHGYELYKNNLNNPDWFVEKLDVTQTNDWNGNRIITDEKIDQFRKSGMPEELIQQEFYCNFDVSLVGAYYSRELELALSQGRIGDCPIDRRYPVHTGWDIGFNDATAIWFFQAIGHEFRFIHYYENNGHSLTHYFNYMEEYARLKNFRYGHMFWPHDADHPMHKYGTGKSFKDVAFESGWHEVNICQMLSVKEGIDLIRVNFPRFRFDEKECEFGLRSLREYCDNGNGKPKHDWASHGADALRTFIMGWYDFMKNEVKTNYMDDDDW